MNPDGSLTGYILPVNIEYTYESIKRTPENPETNGIPQNRTYKNMGMAPCIPQ